MTDSILLFSGGIDSTTLLYDLLNNDKSPILISFFYGQHEKEYLAIPEIVRESKCTYQPVVIKLPIFDDGWVAARNLVMLSHAVAWAEWYGVTEVFYGAIADDYNEFPDCRDDFMFAFNDTLPFATKRHPVWVITPYIYKTKAQVMEIGKALGVDYSKCYTDKKI